MSGSTLLAGVRDLAPRFDAFLVDVWGVIHEGDRPYEGVIGALEGLSAAGRRVVFLTNTSRTGPTVAEFLIERVGISRGLFDDVVTAGDVTRAALLARDPALFRGRAASEVRCHHFGESGFVPWLFELGLTFTEDLAETDLVIATGIVDDERGLAAARAHLAPAAARGVPLVCTNPDRLIPTPRGVRLGPGAVAEAYAALGGPVFLYGKPHPPIYAEARRRLGASDELRIVAIGDTVETDIVGAKQQGLTAVLVVETGVRSRGAVELTLRRFAW